MRKDDLMRTEVYDIEGMSCAACSSAVERVTRKLEGVESSDVNPVSYTHLEYDRRTAGAFKSGGS